MLLRLSGMALMLSTALAACSPPSPPPDARAASGLSGAVSDPVTVRHGPHHVIVARTSIVAHGGQVAHAVRLALLFDGVHPGLRVTEAWHDRRALAFRPAARGEKMCLGPDCLNPLIGTVILSGDDFARAARDGLALRLTGPDGVFDLTVPPASFAEVLRRPRRAA
jgi:hypothetical protein